jgi:hypothetical protein
MSLLLMSRALWHIAFESSTPNCLPDSFLKILGFWPKERVISGARTFPSVIYTAIAISGDVTF